MRSYATTMTTWLDWQKPYRFGVILVMTPSCDTQYPRPHPLPRTTQASSQREVGGKSHLDFGAGSKPCDLNNSMAPGDVSRSKRVRAASGCPEPAAMLPV